MKKATLYYDGDCPFCNLYSKLQQIRKCIDLELRDAREDFGWKEIYPDLELDNGVILIDHNSVIYQGVDALCYLDTICRFQGVFFGLQRWVFSHKIMGGIVYGFAKILRKIALRIMIKS